MFSQKNIGLAIIACFLFVFEGRAQQLIENKNEKNRSQEWFLLIEPFFEKNSKKSKMNESKEEKNSKINLDSDIILLNSSEPSGVLTKTENKNEENLNETDIPEGIQNIGKDMILLVDRIIFGEQDPTQRLDIEPLLEDISFAIDASPVIDKSDIAILMGEKNIDLVKISNNFNVTASGGVSYSFTNNSNGSSNKGGSINPSITVSKRIYDFGALEKRLSLETLKLNEKKIQFIKAKNDLILQSLSSFYEVQRTLLQSRLARENLAARKTFVNFIRERMELGASSSADVIRAEAKVGAALGTVSGSLENLAIARANYRKIFGKEASSYILPKELEVDRLSNANLEEYIQNSNELALVRLSLKMKEIELEQELIDRKGTINSSARVGRTYSESSGVFSDTLSFGINYSAKLFDGGISSGRIEQIRLEIKNLQFEEDRTILNLRQRIEDAFSEYDGKVSSVRSKMLILEGAKDSYNITKELYSFSRISLFEVLSAQEELFNAGKNLIDSIIDRALTKYQLLYLCSQFEEFEEFGI